MCVCVCVESEAHSPSVFYPVCVCVCVCVCVSGPLTVHHAGEGALVIGVGEEHQLLVDKFVVGQRGGVLAVQVVLRREGGGR